MLSIPGPEAEKDAGRPGEILSRRSWLGGHPAISQSYPDHM